MTSLVILLSAAITIKLLSKRNYKGNDGNKKIYFGSEIDNPLNDIIYIGQSVKIQIPEDRFTDDETFVL